MAIRLNESIYMKPKTFLLVHKFSIEQSFSTPYFHIVFLTKMIWKKDLTCSGPKQGVSTFGDWILHKNLYHIFQLQSKCSKQPHIMIIVVY